MRTKRHLALQTSPGGGSLTSAKALGEAGVKAVGIPLEEVVGKERPLGPAMYQLAEMLAEMPE